MSRIFASSRTRLVVAILVVTGLIVATAFYRQRTRVIEGTWVDLFEGSAFFEGMTLQEACQSGTFRKGVWFDYNPPEGSEEFKLIENNRGSGFFRSKYGLWRVSAYSVRFVGHHNRVGLSFGHLGAFPSEFKVDRMVSMVPIKDVRCDVRPD